MLRDDPNSRAKVTVFAKLLIDNVTKEERKFIGRRVGLCNRNFAKEFGARIIEAFGEDGSKIINATYNDFVDGIKDVYSEINERIEGIESGTQKLSNYSEWLAYSYSFFEYKDYIELPGQYETDQEPFIENHIKIAGFKKDVLTLGSIRKPKKLTVNGSNEKEYDLLVKGGEDLRLDQRVQQVFKIMNK